MAKVKVTQLKSLIGRKKNHRLSVKGLGLKGIGDSKILEDTPSVRGMITQVEYLLAVEEVKYCLLYTSPSPRDCDRSRMPSSA